VRPAVALGCLLALIVPATAAAEPATTTPIRHVITVMQENHSFDNYFGTYRGADGLPRKVCMPRDFAHLRKGCVMPFHIGNQAVEGLSDSPQLARTQANRGAMNGFLNAILDQRHQEQPLVMGHYDDREVPFYWNLADQYVLFDRFFGSAMGGTLTNHMFWTTGGPGDDDPAETIPAGGFTARTIFDRLQARGISWKFYVRNYDPQVTFRSKEFGDHGGQLASVPLLDSARFVDDRKLFSHIVGLDQLEEDMRRGTLPAVSYVVPLGAREHPPGSLRVGQNVVRTLVTGLMRSRYWKSSALMLTYDTSGGWYDHVRPPRVDRWGYGFRVPALLVSAWARRGHVDHTTLDFTSILKFIERNWGLEPLTDRDRKAAGLMQAFAFDRPPREPEFVTDRRRGSGLPRTATTPVYVTYGVAFGVAVLIILVALVRELVIRRRAPRLRGPSARVRVGRRGDRP
jgi:phospholipase C